MDQKFDLHVWNVILTGSALVQKYLDFRKASGMVKCLFYFRKASGMIKCLSYES